MATNRYAPAKKRKRNRKIFCDCCGCLIQIPSPSIEFNIPLGNQRCQQCFTLYFANDSYSGVTDSCTSNMLKYQCKKSKSHLNKIYSEPVSSNSSESHLLDLVLSKKPSCVAPELPDKQLSDRMIL